MQSVACCGWLCQTILLIALPHMSLNILLEAVPHTLALGQEEMYCNAPPMSLHRGLDMNGHLYHMTAVMRCKILCMCCIEHDILMLGVTRA